MSLRAKFELDAALGGFGLKEFDDCTDEFIGTNRQDAPSSVSAHASFEDRLACVSNAFRALMANRKELERLDVLDGLRAVLANAEHVEDRSRFDSRVLRSVAAMRGISLRSALGCPPT